MTKPSVLETAGVWDNHDSDTKARDEIDRKMLINEFINE